jgi:hypothetical protein
MDLSNSLISSCEDLFASNILNEEQYVKCKTEIDDSGYYDKIKTTEKKVFNDDRNIKEKEYNNFINQVENVISNIFININKESGGTTSEYNIPTELWDDYYDIMTILNAVINEIVENISKKSIKKYKTKEKSQYVKILQFYNSIDNNRHKIDNINKKTKTIDTMYLNNNDKFMKLKINNNRLYIIIICLYILFAFFLLILFLIKKFK